MGYATLADYELRHGTVEQGDRVLVETLLNDAATMLDSMVEVDPCDAHQADVLRIVSCSMVSRNMESESSAIDQVSSTMGPFSQSFHYASAGGDMWLTKRERDMLGIGAFRLGSIRPNVRGGHHAHR